MAPTFPTLPVDPLPHPAQDYEQLRAKGIELLGKLASTQWTDFNAHDPGITILEQLCYAITDLAWRVGFSIPDLFALAPPLPHPADILTGDPVTLEDLRRLVLDVEGVENAWVEEFCPDPLFYTPSNKWIHITGDPPDPKAVPIRIAGLKRVRVLGPDTVLPEVTKRLHAQRLLATDFIIEPVQRQDVIVTATLEIGPVENPSAILARVLEAIEEVLTPTPQRMSTVEALASGQRSEDIFEGPRLHHGQITRLAAPPRTIQVSDLVHAILDVPSVRAVRSIKIGLGALANESWAVTLPAGTVGCLVHEKDSNLQPVAQRIQLMQSKVAMPVDVARLRRERDMLKDARHEVFHDQRTIEVPKGRDRGVARYRSIRRHLPAAYGLPSSGLSARASASRHAAARQLEAYLLIFDQLLANQHAQLAHVADLLSPAATPSHHTYFAQAVTDLPTSLLAPTNPETSLADMVQTSDTWERRKRLLAHLLARHGEHVGQEGADASDQAIVARRSEFLQNHQQLSGGRGSGANLLSPASTGAFADRVRIKLGFPADSIHVVEHILLRPMPEDLVASDPPGRAFLRDVHRPDPWSMQISIVLCESVLAPGIEDKIKRILHEEAPAHVHVRICWLNSKWWEDFQAEWTRFRTRYAKLILGDRSLRRAAGVARDRIISHLGIGYPGAICVGAWDFTRGNGVDQIGYWGLLELKGATLTAEGLRVTETGWALVKNYKGPRIRDKTLVVWLTLPDLPAKPGGAVMSIENAAGTMFDAIVFGEEETHTWMPGSEGHRRTPIQMPSRAKETSINNGNVIQMMITYSDPDKKALIRLFRNGVELFNYTQGSLQTWTQDDAVILFGPRHTTSSGPMGFMHAVILRAEIYIGALDVPPPMEISAVNLGPVKT